MKIFGNERTFQNNPKLKEEIKYTHKLDNISKLMETKNNIKI